MSPANPRNMSEANGSICLFGLMRFAPATQQPALRKVPTQEEARAAVLAAAAELCAVLGNPDALRGPAGDAFRALYFANEDLQETP
jgi:hypothetical protein